MLEFGELVLGKKKGHVEEVLELVKEGKEEQHYEEKVVVVKGDVEHGNLDQSNVEHELLLLELFHYLEHRLHCIPFCE